ncbi:MAG: ChaN family lipoprotein [Bacteroidota bacterium]
MNRINLKSFRRWARYGLVSPFFLHMMLMQAQTDYGSYKIYSTASQKEISLEEMVADVADVDVLFFGEEHNDSLGHALQDQIYQALLESYGTVTLSLEMFETDCQLIMDEYLAGFIRESKLKKEARAWKNYDDDYRPMVERAKELKQAVIAANAPGRYASMVSGKGLGELNKLSPAAKEYLPSLPIYTDDKPYYQRFKKSMEEVGHSLENDNFFHAQCLWDATMANSIYTHWKKHKKEKIFHLNGRFHTDYKQGTVHQLSRLSGKVQMKNISCFPADDMQNPDWSEYADLGDYVIIHPEVKGEDVSGS